MAKAGPCSKVDEGYSTARAALLGAAEQVGEKMNQRLAEGTAFQVPRVGRNGWSP